MTPVIEKISAKISKANIDIRTKFRLNAEIGRLKGQYYGEKIPASALRDLSSFVKDSISGKRVSVEKNMN